MTQATLLDAEQPNGPALAGQPSSRCLRVRRSASYAGAPTTRQVARPGLAPIAGALAVEVMATALQHPAGAAAPALGVRGVITTCDPLTPLVTNSAHMELETAPMLLASHISEAATV